MRRSGVARGTRVAGPQVLTPPARAARRVRYSSTRSFPSAGTKSRRRDGALMLEPGLARTCRVEAVGSPPPFVPHTLQNAVHSEHDPSRSERGAQRRAAGCCLAGCDGPQLRLPSRGGAACSAAHYGALAALLGLLTVVLLRPERSSLPSRAGSRGSSRSEIPRERRVQLGRSPTRALRRWRRSSWSRQRSSSRSTSF